MDKLAGARPDGKRGRGQLQQIQLPCECRLCGYPTVGLYRADAFFGHFMFPPVSFTFVFIVTDFDKKGNLKR